MLNKFKLIFVTAFIFMLCNQVFAKSAEEWAEELGYDQNVSYDATRLVEAKEGQFTQKVHFAPRKQMMEMNTGGLQSKVILREDQGKSYMLMPSMGMYREMDINQGVEQSGNAMDFHTVEKVSTETINGFRATKYKTKFEDTEGKGEGFLWITDEGIFIKSDMIYASSGMQGQRMKMELTDINIRSQDPNLFEIPSNLKPMSGISGMKGEQKSQDAASDNSNQAPGIVKDMGSAAKDETRKGMVNETRDAVKKGLKGLFGK